MVGSTATLKLAPHGKRLVAQSMYSKGGAFIGAALLVRREAGYEFVVLHLLCQGVEIIFKSLLLMLDYDKFARVTQLLYNSAVRVANLDHRPLVDKPKPDPHAQCVQ